MSDLGPEARGLLQETRGCDAPSTDDRRRVLARVMGEVGGAAALATMAKTSAALPRASTGATGIRGAFSTSLVGKMGIAAFLVVGLGTGVALGVHRTAESCAGTSVSTAKTVSSTLTARAAPAAAFNVEPVAVSEVSSPVAATSSAPATMKSSAEIHLLAKARSTKQAASSEQLEAEAQLLASADMALRQGRPKDAIARLDEHARRFPNAVLSEERTAERLLARCAIDPSGARTSAASFLLSHPTSPAADRIRASCGTNP